MERSCGLAIVVTLLGVHVACSSDVSQTSDGSVNEPLSGTTWQSQPVIPETSTATVEFDAVPSTNDEDVVIGLSKGVPSDYPNLAAIVRFADNGIIDVRNGGTYAAAASLRYTAGTSYHVKLTVDVTAKTYGVVVTPQGQAPVVLASSYAFRSEQAHVTVLDTLSTGSTVGSVAISNLNVKPPAANGACGSANGVAVASAPTTGLCSAGAASAVAGSGPWTWTCAGSNGGSTASCSAPRVASSCPHSAAAAAASLNDGCSRALTGTPQVPNLFSSYGTHRPYWDVAGVDYAVGAPTNINYTDPAGGGLPAGCSYASLAVTCSGNNITLQGWDFTLHGGIKLTMNGSNNVVTKNKFAAGTNCADPIINVSAASNSTLTLTYNSVDGGAPTCKGGETYNTEVMARLASGSTFTVQYNYFAHAYQDDIDVSGPSSGSGAVDMRFNVFVDNGLPGNHSDDFQTCGGILGPVTTQFNTMYNSYADGYWTQVLHAEAQCTGTLNDTTMSQNVIIAVSGTSNACTGSSYPTNCSANELFACKDDSGNNRVNSFSASENYVDMQGALSYTADDCTGNANASNISWGSPKPNVDMRKNTTFTK